MPLVPEFLAGRTPPDLYHSYLEPAFEPWGHVLLDTLGPQGRMLDLACGTGLLSRLAASRPDVTRIDAVDVAPPMIDKAQALTNAAEDTISFAVAGADTLPFDDSTFDCAVCQQGLQFFP
ncbi:MAG: class I SAM-dependent methyltransferase, partial [Pseudomonadota bacterium]